jgi:hypothetical protein
MVLGKRGPTVSGKLRIKPLKSKANPHRRS